MFLSQLLEEYRESEAEQKQYILDKFLSRLWKSKYTFKKYKKKYKFEVYPELLDYRQDLVELFNQYNDIKYTVCKSKYTKKVDPIDYIRIHINNMYGLLFDKDVYYKSEHYKLLLTPKKEYFRLVNIKKKVGNIDDVKFEDVENNIKTALKEAETIKFKSINRKSNMKFSEYKKIINTYIERMFNNYIPAEEYEKKYGWNLEVKVDGWSEDSYIVKYFNKSLTGYMRNHVRKINGISKYGKYIECSNCGILISPTNNSHKFCMECAKEKIRERDRLRKRRNITIE